MNKTKSDSARKPKLKLPKVWVEVWNGTGYPRSVAESKFKPAYPNLSVHQYAPVQPPRRCVWVENEEGQWETECLGLFEFIEGGPEDNEQKFCGYCGGRLKAKHYVEPARKEGGSR